MKLFQCADAKLTPVSPASSIHTPLGRVRLGVTAGETKQITDGPPSQTYALPAGGWVACWHRQDFTLELLVCRPQVSVPDDMQLTDCWAGLWRLEAHYPLGPNSFTAAWEDGYTWQDGGPNSGQWLYAKTWDDGKTEVSIGTEDDEALAERSHSGRGLPPEWEVYFRVPPENRVWDRRGPEFWRHEIHGELGDRGMALPLPPLAVGQLCQVSFAIAWSHFQEHGSADWYVVDLSDAQILAGGGCL